MVSSIFIHDKAGRTSFVGGFLFLDMMSHDNFSEAQSEIVKNQIENYKKKFKKNPPSFTADKLYGSLENRKIMKKKESAAPPTAGLGKKGKNSNVYDRWFRKEQRQRNQIEGSNGFGKEHYGLEEILYHGVEGAEMWVRCCLLGMNLKAALTKI